MALPAAVAAAIAPLFAALPPDRALSRLVVSGAPDPGLVRLVETALRAEALPADGPLASALWLYVDALERSHKISQGIDDATGSYWHGIMHRREGDFANSHHWFRKVGAHPAIALVAEAYDPHRFVDDVERTTAVAADGKTEPLVALQRREWQTLFAWSATHCDG